MLFDEDDVCAGFLDFVIASLNFFGICAGGIPFIMKLLILML